LWLNVEPALVQIAERRLKEQQDKEADSRHHDTLGVEELAFVFGLNIDEEREKKKIELQSRPERRRRAIERRAGAAAEEEEEDMEEGEMEL